jgi:hypothetical protein
MSLFTTIQDLGMIIGTLVNIHKYGFSIKTAQSIILPQLYICGNWRYDIIFYYVCVPK